MRPTGGVKRGSKTKITIVNGVRCMVGSGKASHEGDQLRITEDLCLRSLRSLEQSLRG